MQLSDIISKFNSPKPNGNNSYMVKCPCHNDNQQSLCISEKNGKILMNCFAGCRAEDITNAIGVEMKDLFVANPPCNKVSKPPSVEYIYSDTLKKIRYAKYNQVTGKWDKRFYWKHKDQNGQWQKGKDSGKVPLYKQNLLSNVPTDETVYIVEGEKDTDTMTDKLGFIAVSSPNGATKGNTSGKWSSNYNRLFKDLNVAIIPDNDDIGRTYAETIASELLPFAKSVKIINLSDEWENLKNKGDITDIYESETPSKGKTVAETVSFKLSALTDCTKPYEQRSETAAASTEPRKTIIAPVWAYEDNGQWKIDEKIYITEFVKSHGVKCINGQLYSVDGAISDGKAKQIIIKEILYYVKANHGDKAEKLLKGIKSYCYIEPPKPSLDKIHFKNSTLSKDKDGLFNVWSDEKEFCINRIQSNYNPNAPTPKLFNKYLQEVYYSDDIKTLQQYCGYCLLPTTVMQKALIIIGDGGEGKSVLGAILNAIIGENNCYNASIKDLEGNFGIANVENKLIYLDDDVSEKAITNSGIFKSLVTNKNTIEAKKKYQQSNVIKSYIRFICFGNFSLQALYDTSDGFYRRLLALRVKPKDDNRIDNPFIDRQIIENEAEGVINWLVQGLNEVIKQNFDIYTSDRTKAESERIKHENDSVLAFLRECDDITIRTDLKVHTSSLYSTYSEFCDENALIKLQITTFPKAVKNKGKQFGITPSENITIKGRRARGFRGIGYSVDIS